MSLNGLDDPAVINAYQNALAEAGGWLLLKYISRDEVALLGRGTGGVPDVRANVEGYEEKSPLYGFLQYRRRKIVLKYVPEGMSRLVQARTTVQFQSILDKFSPQDTSFEFKAPVDLTESALSSACLLHAVSGSITSSSSSLRRRRLMEIAEDSEEGSPASNTEIESSRSPEDENKKRLSQASDATAVPPTMKGDESPKVSHVIQREADSRSETASVHSISHKKFLDQLHQDSFERRSSTQSARPSLQELNYAAPYRQKVKLEHRPSVDIHSRPRTAGSMSRGQDYRPTAALPAGVRSRKPAGSSNRPKSTPDAPPVPTLASLRNAPPVPLLIPPPTLSISKPKLSPGAKSMNALPSSGMSPEKQRLMKALELRKKQMEKRTLELQKKQEQKKAIRPQSTIVESIEDKENVDHSSTQITSSDITPAETALVTGSRGIAMNMISDDKPLSADLAKADSAVEMVVVASKNIESSLPRSDTGILRDRTEREEDSNSDADKINGNDTNEMDLQPQGRDKLPMKSNIKNSVTIDTTDLEEIAQISEGDTPTQQSMDMKSSWKGLTENMRTGEQNEDEEHGEENKVENVVVNIRQEELEPPQANVSDSMQLDSSAASKSDRGETASRETASLAETEEHQSHAVDEKLRAEDIPLPLESGDDLEDVPTTARLQVALEAVSTALEQPLPHPEETDTEKTEKQKRIALLEPIQVPTPDFSDDENLLSDDSLMEELKTATVHEAQPVSVGKGPLSPDGEPRTPLEAWQTRAVSNPSRQPGDFSSLPAEARSISATFVDNNNSSIRPVPVLQAKKVNVSSGISKRIKALEMFNNNRDNVSSSTGKLSAPGNVASPGASAFEKFRKRSSVSMTGSYLSTTPSARSSFISTSESPPLNRSDSRSISKTNSVSVTARIVRDPTTPPIDLNANPIESNGLSLQRSPLTVEHESPDPRTSDPTKSDGVPELRSNAVSRRNSTETTVPRSDSRASSQSRFDDWGNKNGSTGDIGTSPDDKKDSRRSRLMRRMSSLRSPSRKSLISPPAVDKQQQQPSPHAEESIESVRTNAVDIGEVNVQFPDTLLWKRRFLRIDDQGYLVLTPGNMDTGARNIIKRYHLSEFKTPCLPDEERQELPNSILLDFRNGSTLQCACESRKGQAAALQTLVDAHSAYHH